MKRKNILIALGVLGGIGVLWYLNRPKGPRIRSWSETQSMLNDPKTAPVIVAELKRNVAGRG